MRVYARSAYTHLRCVYAHTRACTLRVHARVVALQATVWPVRPHTGPTGQWLPFGQPCSRRLHWSPKGTKWAFGPLVGRRPTFPKRDNGPFGTTGPSGQAGPGSAWLARQGLRPKYPGRYQPFGLIGPRGTIGPRGPKGLAHPAEGRKARPSAEGRGPSNGP